MVPPADRIGRAARKPSSANDIRFAILREFDLSPRSRLSPKVNPMKSPLSLGVALLLSTSCLLGEPLREQAEASVRRAVDYFHSLNAHGGYVYAVTPDLTMRWGESPVDADTIEVQPPGTPAVGQSFLRAYRATGYEGARNAAMEAAKALIRGQNTHGGWDHTINFADLSNETVSFDDNQSQSAISFLLALDQAVDDPAIAAATRRAVDMMIATQLANGGWPHLYPARGNYHDFATFNDGGINDCIRVMIEASQRYPDDAEIRRSLKRVARFLVISQLPPPQPGWAQQYNEFLQPAWARTFEAASVCPAVTIKNVDTLIDLTLCLDDATLLEPIPHALRWLREIRMENGQWARFVEIGTNRALYFDRDRIRVNSIAELHPERATGYAYEIDISSALEAGTRRYEQAMALGRRGLRQFENAPLTGEAAAKRLAELTRAVEQILAHQEPNGAWLTRKDRFKATMPKGERWNGQYEVMDRISSGVRSALGDWEHASV